MLFPRFSLRTLLGITTACCVFFFVTTFAVRGNYWAIALVGALGSVVLAALIHAVFFVAARTVGAFSPRSKIAQQPRSPFADDSPSPQVISPVEQE